MYNFNIRVEKIIEINNMIYVKSYNNLYILCKIEKEREKIIKYSILDNSYYTIIKNNDGNIITRYKENDYILYKVDDKTEINVSEIKRNIKLDYEEEKNWINNWIIKIDKTEKAIENIQYEIVEDTKDYFMGLAELSIMILKYHNLEKIEKEKSICRIRITEESFRNPNNIIIDYKERDIAEYIKYLFYEKNINSKNIIRIIEVFEISQESVYMVLARLMFPTNYFDCLEKIIIDEDKEIDKIKKIIDRADDYEQLLYRYIERYCNNLIYEMEWIKKNKKINSCF